MTMKGWQGKACTIHVLREHKVLFFTVRLVEEVTDSHITFLDKWGKRYTFRLQDVTEIHEVDR